MVLKQKILSRTLSALFTGAGGLALSGVLAAALPVQSAQAHGYVLSPTSRAYLCSTGANTNCGQIQYEPQSTEAPKGFPAAGPADGQIASAGGKYPELDQQTATRWTRVSMQAGQTTFSWHLTASHATAGWSYYLTRPGWNANQPLTRADFDLTPFCTITYNGKQPPYDLSHQCNVPARQGYQVILAVWTIADTGNAFYHVIDADFGGAAPPPPPPPPAPPPPAPPPPTTPPAPPSSSCATPWSASAIYNGGSLASENSTNYKANWWTQGDDPATHSGPGGSGQPWTSQGACGADTPPPPPTTPPPPPPPPPTTPPPPPPPPPTTPPPPPPPPPPTPPPPPPPTTPPSPPAGGNEACRPDGLVATPNIDVPYCLVYDTNGREKLPNNLNRRIIGYFTSWRTGKDGTPAYLVDQIPWNKLSGINYAFAHIGPDNKISVNQAAAGNPATDMTWPNDPNASMDPQLGYTGHFNLLARFKAQHPGVKTFISVGGWSETGGYLDANGTRVASGGFYTMTQSQAAINTFADSAVAFIRQYGFDGVDIDYEYATSNAKAGNPDDFTLADGMRGKLWSGYEALMQTLRQKLDAAAAKDGRYYMLTAAVPGSGWLLRGEEVQQVVQYLDFANIMSYDLHGAWNLYVAGLAPLYDDGRDPELSAGGVYGAYQGMGYLNTDWTYHYFRGAMPGGRINIGVPFYTRGWTGVTGGTNGMYGKAAMPDQNQCPAGTGGKIGSSTPCGNGATGIDNLWHDLDGQGKEVPSGVNPIWHVLNLQNGVRGSYAAAYGVPDASKVVGVYSHQFDPVTKAEWWWDATTQTLLTGDADQAIAAKADYVAAGEAGGVMIWELAGDYAYNTAKSEYGMGATLIDSIYSKLTKAQPYGATKADTGEAMPSEAIPLDITFTDFALGDNNYPINPKVTFFNDSSQAIPAGSTITFDYATSNLSNMSEQNGWGLTLVKAGHTGSNVGGIKGNFNTVRLKVPSGGIAAGGSAWTKLSWQLPMAQISNVRVDIGGSTYGATYDAARGVTVVNPGDGGGDNGGGDGQDPGQCTGNPWAAGTVYNGGAKVYYDGHYWTARWWTQGNQPGSGGDWGPWADAGSC